MLKISVVIPIYNEEESITELYFLLRYVMDTLGKIYEIIFVNDGSEDGSQYILNKLADIRGSNLVIVELDKHYGQSAAMQTGFDVAQGELIITMDGDLQNDPRDIPRLLSKIEEGYDVVCGWRYERKDTRFKIFLSTIFRILRKLIFKEKVHDPGCTLRVFKRDVIKNIYLFKGSHRFFSLIMHKLGYKIGEIKVEHRHRKFGKSKYNFYNRVFEVLIVFMEFIFFNVKKIVGRKSYYKVKQIIRSS